MIISMRRGATKEQVQHICNRIEELGFKDWSMAFLNLNNVDKAELANYSYFLEKGFTSEISREHLSFAQKLLVKFKDALE